MAGVAYETIIRVKADLESAIKDVKRLQEVMGGLQKQVKASEGLSKIRPVQGAVQAFGEINRYYGVMGKSSGMVQEKMKALDDQIRTLTKTTLPANIEAAKKLKIQYDSLAKSGSLGDKMMRGLDGLTGGKISQAKDMLSSMGIDMAKFGKYGAIAAAAIVGMKVAWDQALLPGIKFNMMLEQQETGFRVMLGPADEAAKMMGTLKGLALTTGIGFAEGAQSTKQLIAYGFAADEVSSSLKMLKTVASATGTTVNDLTYVYGTLRAQGRAYTRDLMQFGMRGIPIFEYLADVMGVSVKEVRKLAEAGKVGFPEVEKAFERMTGAGGRFNNMLEEMMKTTTGLTQLIQVDWDLARSEMAKPLDGGIKQFLQLTLSLVKGVAPLLQLIGKLLSPILMAFNSIYSVVVLVFQAIGFIAEAINKMFNALGGMITYMDKVSVSMGMTKEQAELLRAALGLTLAIMVGMINPVAGIGIALVSLQGPLGWLVKQTQKLLDMFRGIKEITEFKIPPIHVPVVVDVTSEEAKKQLTDMVKKFKFESKMKGETSWMPTPEQLGKIQAAMEMANTKGFTYSWEEIINLVQKEADTSMAQAVYDGLMGAADESAKDFWSRFKRLGALGNIGEMADFYETGTAAAAAYVKGWDVAIAGERSMGELLSLSLEDITSNVSTIAQDAYDVLYNKIKMMRGEMALDPSAATPAYMALYEALIEKAKEYYALIEKEGGKAKAAKEEKAIMIDMMSYMKSRAEWMNKETDELYKQVTLRTKIKDIGKSTIDTLGRALAINAYQYKLDVKELAKKYEENDARKAGHKLELDIAKLKWEQADAQTKLLEGQRLYNEALSGSSDYWTNIQSEMGLLLRGKPIRGKKNSDEVTGYTGPGISEYTQAGAMAVQLGAQGTDAGNIMAGGNPILGLITELVKVLASLEEFGQTLNFIKTIGKGFAYALQQADKAFRPLNTVLMMVGELIGSIIGPGFEMIGIFLSDIAQVMAPIINVLMKLFKAIMPLVVLFFKIANPIMILFEVLAKMIGMSEEELELKRQQIEDMKELYDKEIKSLQDLYNVGAISGKQYEEMLANLKAGMATAEDTANPDDPFAEMSVAINKMVELLEKYLYPLITWIAKILGPVITFALDIIIGLIKRLTPVIEAVNLVLTTVGGVIKLIWESIVAVFTGDWLKVGELAKALGKAISDAWASFWTSIKNWFADFVNIFIKALNAIPGVDIGLFQHAPDTTDDGSGQISTGKQTYGYATGTPSVPRDMLANIHKGEMVVPNTFADAIRRGDVTLGGAKGSSGNTTQVFNITVEGNVISERDFYKTVGSELTKLSRQGYV